jgi:predicted  nucleic acid-binding Zn-ribbon protein
MESGVMLEVIKIVVPTLIGFFSACWGIYKFLDKRLTKIEDSITELKVDVAEASGANVNMGDYLVNSRRSEDKWQKAIGEAEKRTDQKIQPLEKRLDKLEAKVFKD